MTATPTSPPPVTVGGLRHRWLEASVGRYVLAADGDALVGVWRENQTHWPRPERLGRPAASPDAVLDAAAAQLIEYLDGVREEFDLPLAPRGTDFQRRVWEALRRIPRGATTTYGALARELGVGRGAQAVGAAVGANPLSIVVPCHRVVSTAGALTGYAGGVETKAHLLRIEGVGLPDAGATAR